MSGEGLFVSFPVSANRNNAGAEKLLRKVRAPMSAAASLSETMPEDPWLQNLYGELEEQCNRENVRSDDPARRERESVGELVGVKTGKLCGEQDQIGEKLCTRNVKLSGRSLRGMLFSLVCGAVGPRS